MKLYEYAIELANAITGEQINRDHNITLTLLPEHLAYRKVIGAVIYNQFTSQSAREVLGNVVLEYEALSTSLEFARKTNEELLSRIAELESKPVLADSPVASKPKKVKAVKEVKVKDE